MDSKESLNNFIKKSSQYFSLEEGEESIVKFLGAEPIANRFNNGQTECIRYTLEQDGRKIYWDRGSRSLALQISKYPEGTVIGITKYGDGNKTRYVVRAV